MRKIINRIKYTTEMNYTEYVKVVSKKERLVFLCVDTIKNDNNVYIYGKAKSEQYKDKHIQTT